MLVNTHMLGTQMYKNVRNSNVNVEMFGNLNIEMLGTYNLNFGI